jgi:hypothetical protein
MSEHIFISHSSIDNQQVEQLANALEMANFSSSVWVDFRNIRSGDVWVREIEEHLRSCAVFLLVWSASARRSKWVNKEILTAIELEKPIIIARLDDEPLSLAIIDIQAVSLKNNFKQGVQRLIDGLKGDKPQVIETEPIPTPNNFFRYLKTLPNGKQNTLIARDLFHWAGDHADDVTFGGKITPAFQARVMAEGAVDLSVFSVRAYPKRPAIQIHFMYLMNHQPYKLEGLRHSTLKSLNRLMTESDQFVLEQAERAPTIPLAYLDSADKIELFKQIMAEIFDNLRGI